MPSATPWKSSGGGLLQSCPQYWLLLLLEHDRAIELADRRGYLGSDDHDLTLHAVVVFDGVDALGGQLVVGRRVRAHLQGIERDVAHAAHLVDLTVAGAAACRDRRIDTSRFFQPERPQLPRHPVAGRDGARN